MKSGTQNLLAGTGVTSSVRQGWGGIPATLLKVPDSTPSHKRRWLKTRSFLRGVIRLDKLINLCYNTGIH